MKTISALMKIIRPLNVLITFMTVIVAAAVTGTVSPLDRVLIAALVAALITAGANVVNDIFDIRIDRINRPHRPLPAGKLSIKTAWIYFTILFLSAFAIAYLLDPAMFLIPVWIGLLLYFYSYRLKRMLLWGNLCVSFATAMAFLYGGMAVYRVEFAIYPALFSFFFHFGREIIKDIEDKDGDARENALTFPIRYGVRRSLILTYTTFFLLVILTIYPYISGVYNVLYLIIVILGVHTVLVYVAVSSWINSEPKNLGRLSIWLKIDMLVGLLAIFIGSH